MEKQHCKGNIFKSKCFWCGKINFSLCFRVSVFFFSLHFFSLEGWKLIGMEREKSNTNGKGRNDVGNGQVLCFCYSLGVVLKDLFRNMFDNEEGEEETLAWRKIM